MVEEWRRKNPGNRRPLPSSVRCAPSWMLDVESDSLTFIEHLLCAEHRAGASLLLSH